MHDNYKTNNGCSLINCIQVKICKKQGNPQEYSTFSSRDNHRRHIFRWSEVQKTEVEKTCLFSSKSMGKWPNNREIKLTIGRPSLTQNGHFSAKNGFFFWKINISEKQPIFAMFWRFCTKFFIILLGQIFLNL